MAPGHPRNSPVDIPDAAAQLDNALAGTGARAFALADDDGIRAADLRLPEMRPSMPAQAAAVDPAVVDYLGVGPVRATATKPDAAAPLGPEGLRAVVAAAPVPCVAIGGIHPDNLDALRGTGIAGFCVVSEICAAPDPEAAARSLQAQWRPGTP